MANQNAPIEIDYSGITPPPAAQPSAWRSPRHVFFGRKDPNTGEMEEEPVYTHKAYPSMRYAKVDGKITVKIVNTEDEDAALGPEWKDSPADHGVITAPAYGQAHTVAVAPAAPAPSKKAA